MFAGQMMAAPRVQFYIEQWNGHSWQRIREGYDNEGQMFLDGMRMIQKALPLGTKIRLVSFYRGVPQYKEYEVTTREG